MSQVPVGSSPPRHHQHHKTTILLIRTCLLIATCCLIKFNTYISTILANFYNGYLMRRWWFHLACFETLMVPVVYITIQTMVFLMERIPEWRFSARKATESRKVSLSETARGARDKSLTEAAEGASTIGKAGGESIWKTESLPPRHKVLKQFRRHDHPIRPYKLHPDTTWRTIYPKQMLFDTLRYMLPLLLLDTVMVKRFHGANWKWDRWFYLWRALPEEAPSALIIVGHVVGVLLLFDTFFFLQHLAWHKIPWLYQLVHREHHNHSEALHTQVVDQLSIIERLSLVLSANLALNIFNAHPFTRCFFIVLFVFLLTENHSGIDFPIWYDKIVPFEWMGGARRHWEHHVKGERFYAPFFRHWDALLEAFVTDVGRSRKDGMDMKKRRWG